MEHIVPNINTIQIENKETRTNIPSIMLKKARLWLDSNKIEYQVYTGEQIPDDWIQGWHFRGKEGIKHTAVIVSHLNSAQLIAAIEELFYIPEENI